MAEYEKRKLLNEIFHGKITSPLKKCAICLKLYPATKEFFYINKNCKLGFDWYCKNCKKEKDKDYHKYRTYGLTEEKYYGMLKSQDYKCGICGKILKEGIHTNIDHDYKTGKIRGILCRYCNLLLGHAYDNRLILAKALKYLEKNKESRKKG